MSLKFHVKPMSISEHVNNDILTNFSYGTVINGCWNPLKLPMWSPGATLPSILPLNFINCTHDEGLKNNSQTTSLPSRHKLP